MASQQLLSEQDHLTARIRHKLQQDQVKLWLSPYFENNTPVEDALKELALNYSDIMAIPQNDILSSLQFLQTNALEKLASRTRFQATGVASLRLKIVGTQNVEDILITLQETGKSLKERIIGKMPSGSHLKLICNGILLKDDERLHDQRVTNNSQILVLPLATEESAQKAEEAIIREVHMIKNDALLLASKQEEDSSVHITDQSGKKIQLPPEEKKSLVIAMALHEKGRSALKRNQVSFALMLFHEADAQFTNCRSDLLSAVDNAGLLNLDIAWCYLLLGSASDIPDAALRLERCEKTLSKSYGPQMERLLTLKGTTGNEAVLFMRLRLLQGVVAYHQGRPIDAARLLQQAKEELSRLVIRDDDLTQLVAFGYTVAEARLGLRAMQGDLNEACLYIQRRREEKAERQQRERDEDERNRERKKLGKTVNGQWVNLGYLKTLQDMGFDRGRVTSALKRTNNDINRSLEWLQTEGQASFDGGACALYSEESVAQIVSLGFPVELAREMLDKCDGNLERAVEKLTSATGSDPEDEKPSTSASKRSRLEDQEEKEAYKRLAHDLPASEDDYLDSNLQLESAYLEQYLKLTTGAI